MLWTSPAVATNAKLKTDTGLEDDAEGVVEIEERFFGSVRRRSLENANEQKGGRTPLRMTG
ncbi:MAG TPA: hypothetical protein VIY66_07175 [Candidatus Acidoferrales bacterium]